MSADILFTPLIAVNREENQSAPREPITEPSLLVEDATALEKCVMTSSRNKAGEYA
ncbi:MAG: hypothetical protein ABIR84_01755 [Candidatus Nitrotoga sp.]